MSTQDITYAGLAYIYLMLAFPLVIITVYRTGLTRSTLVSIVRMSVQLVLVGVYLEFIFTLNNPFLNGGWVLVMISVAAANVAGSAGLRKRRLLLQIGAAIALSTLGVVAVFLGAALRPDPVYDARYLIPIGGMILGNCMRGNIVGLERFFSGIRENRKEYLSALFMGATVAEAVRPWMRRALVAALAPTISTMATMGIVSLPGMMTGQILGGADPLTAIRYQMAIMVAITVSVALGAWLNIVLCMRAAFDEYGVLRTDIFTS